MPPPPRTFHLSSVVDTMKAHTHTMRKKWRKKRVRRLKRKRRKMRARAR